MQYSTVQYSTVLCSPHTAGVSLLTQDWLSDGIVVWETADESIRYDMIRQERRNKEIVLRTILCH